MPFVFSCYHLDGDMSGETEKQVSGWTVDTLHEHFRRLREDDLLAISLMREMNVAILQERDRRYADIAAERALTHGERDRRYYEIAQEREKALKIKEQADRDALDLARQIQIYKDEKANELREQINSERGLYATKDDLKAAVEKLEATLAPIAAAISLQQGRGAGLNSGWGYLIAGIGLIATLIVIFTYLKQP